MPTGYTSDIYSGDVSFNKFVWRCAKAFEDDRSPDYEYHLAKYEKYKKEYKNFKTLSKVEIRRKAELYNAQSQKSWQNGIKKSKQLSKQYNKMIEKVKQWRAPSKAHKALKDFMIDQLEESLSFDTYSAIEADIFKPEPISAEAWYQRQIDSFKHDIDYHKKQMKAAEKNLKFRKLLSKSIPYEE